MDKGLAFLVSVATFAVAACLLNSRLGKHLQEAVTDWIAHRSHQLVTEIIPGLVRLVLLFFRRAVEAVERFLYAVDEKLRFRKGESRLALLWKPAAGVVWFFVTYFVRIYINLMIEPTVNPIKHFPVVTVAAKVMLPLTVPFLRFLVRSPQSPLLFLGPMIAPVVAGATVLFLPGVFGFLVWELKENWRLYEANRPPTLRPVPVGHHGETVRRLLKRGFHSGTLPRLYRRLRRAERRALHTGRWSAAHRHRRAIREVEEAVRRFIEREFLALLEDSRNWSGLCVGRGGVAAGCNRVRFRLPCPALAPGAVEIAFEELDGRVIGRLHDPCWLPRLTPRQSEALRVALAGLFQLAGVQVVWSGAGLPEEPLGPSTEPAPFRWKDWVEAWDRDQTGKDLPGPLAPAFQLPRPTAPCPDDRTGASDG